MSEIYRIIYFQRSLRQRTEEEVQYRRGATLAESISVALDFECAHSGGYNNHAATSSRPSAHCVTRDSSDAPEPMEIENAQPFQRSLRV